MRTSITLAVSLLVLSPVLAADPEPADEAEAKAEASPPPASAKREPSDDALVVDAGSLEASVVCERYVPTGSRISRTRCVARGETEQSEAERRMLRQDVDQMRRQQMDRALAQQRAVEDFARRAAAARAGANR